MPFKLSKITGRHQDRKTLPTLDVHASTMDVDLHQLPRTNPASTNAGRAIIFAHPDGSHTSSTSSLSTLQDAVSSTATILKEQAAFSHDRNFEELPTTTRSVMTDTTTPPQHKTFKNNFYLHSRSHAPAGSILHNMPSLCKERYSMSSNYAADSECSQSICFNPAVRSTTDDPMAEPLSPHDRIWNANFSDMTPNIIHPGPDMPRYTRNIPQRVMKIFENHPTGRMRSTDAGFRELVRVHCGMPAYFGITLFNKMFEARRHAFQLTKLGVLAESCMYYLPGYKHSIQTRPDQDASVMESERTITLRDFARIWANNSKRGKAETSFILLVTPVLVDDVRTLENDIDQYLPNEPFPCPDNRHLTMFSSNTKKIKVNDFRSELERPGSVYMRDMQPLVESLVMRHPDLVGIKQDSVIRERYVTSVLMCIYSSLHGLTSGRITRSEIRESNVIEAFYACASRPLRGVLPFSLENFDEFHHIFGECLSYRSNNHCAVTQNHSSMSRNCPPYSAIDKYGQDKALVSLESIHKVLAYDIPYCVLEKAVNAGARTLTSGVYSMLNFEDFMSLCLALKDRMTDTSISYWFHALDFDDDGFLSSEDIAHAYLVKQEYTLMRIGKRIPSLRTALHQIENLFRPQRSHPVLEGWKLSSLEIRKVGCGRTLFDMLIDLGVIARDRQDSLGDECL